MGWSRYVFGVLALLMCAFMLSLPVHAQDFDLTDEVWKPIMEEDGLAFSYIFYREADTRHNGVVIRLINTNAYDVAYEFTVVFRAGSDEAEEFVEGEIEAGRMKTGESEGLFWIPFLDERQIREVGVRGWQITKIED